MELVRFDLQPLENPEISGVEYQQGTLFGTEVREYLLHKFGHRCVYCSGRSGDPVLEVEHLTPRSRGGTNRVSNLAIACHTCNQAKGNRTPAEWAASLAGSRQALDQARAAACAQVQAQARRPLRDAAAVNSTRWVLWHRLRALGLLLEAATGGQTKWNRTRQGYPKAHWIDAACVGATGAAVRLDPAARPLVIQARGHGKRQRCGTDRHGFPTRHAPRAKRFQGFQTGDLVRAHIPHGRRAGIHMGTIAIRHRPSFRLNGFDVHPQYLRVLQHADGYAYAAAPPQG